MNYIYYYYPASGSIILTIDNALCIYRDPLLYCNLAGLALGLAILEAIYFVYILLVLDYFMKELTL